MRRTPRENLEIHVPHRPADECWPWTGTLSTRGYGVFDADGRQVKAHRMMYEQEVGPIPAGGILDHECHNRDLSCAGGDSCPHRACCNPTHVRVTDRGTNTLAGRSLQAKYANATTCIWGHPFDIVRPSGGRDCRTCKRRRDRERRARNRADA